MVKGIKADMAKESISGVQSEHKYRVEVLVLTLFSIQFVTEYYIGSGMMPKFFIYINALLTVFLPLYGMNKNHFLSSGGTIRFKSTYEAMYFFCFAVVSLITLAFMPFNGRISRDVVCFCIYLQIFTALVYADLNESFFLKLFRIASIISVIGFVYAVSSINFDFSLALNRGYQGEEIFYYAGLFWASTAYVVLAVMMKKDIVWSFICLTLNVVLNLIIVKRMILLEVGVCFFVLLLMLFKEKRNFKIVLKLLAIVGAVFLVLRFTVWDMVSGLFESVFERTTESAVDIDSFNRFVESKNFFSEASFFDIALGGGFGATHTGLGKEAEALHVGWTNFILKGGIPLFLIMTIPFVIAVKRFAEYRYLPTKSKLAMWILLLYFPTLFLANCHAFYPKLFLLCWSLINVSRPVRVNDTSR